MTVVRHDEVSVHAALGALARAATPGNGADRLALKVVTEHIADLAAAHEEAVAALQEVESLFDELLDTPWPPAFAWFATWRGRVHDAIVKGRGGDV